MNSELDQPYDIRSLCEQLSRAATDIDKDDLPQLANMHSWSESIADASAPDTDYPNASAREHATKLAQMLETLILGEADDPEATIDLIGETVVELADSEVSTPSAANVTTDEHEPCDAEVAAKLGPIFGVESTTPDAAATEDQPVTPEPNPLGSVDDEHSSEEDPADSSADRAASSPNAETLPAQPEYQSEPLIISDDEVEMVSGFVEEAGEHIDSIEAAVLDVERAPEDTEAIDSLFRPFHTIKGAAGFLNMRDIVSLTHEAETLLDQARKGSRKVTPGLIDLIFEVVDILKIQFEGIQTHLADPTDQAVPQPRIETMIANLRDVVTGRIKPVGSSPVAGEADKKVGENLVDQGAVPQEVVDFAVAKQGRDSEAKRVGETLMEMGVASPKQISQALRPQAKRNSPASGTSSGGEQSVRIDTSKLDALVDMVGELVISQTLVSANPHVSLDPKLIKDVSQTTKIVRDVQDAAMAMRMIPIGPTFQKMARLVRDVSRKVGKTVQLTISGEDTELDKNVIQQIGDPLVHMVRNAVDHGIESPEARRAAKKPDSGSVSLSAFHSGGNIVVEISDDGKGLNADVLIKKGIEKGIVQPDEQLSDDQAYNLIFAPGFSTAETVTGVSGRGVGMDVVRRNIENLRGKCDIASTPGKGSTFSIRLPLTLAIIDGMVLRIGAERFIIQTVTVEKALRPTPEQITTVQSKGAVLNVRGRLIPLVPMGRLFKLGQQLNPCDAMVVIAQYAGGEIGLVVDELLGQQQVVIKSLGERFKNLRGISGAAILGDGRVGLILDVAGIVAAHSASRLSQNRDPVADQEVGGGRDSNPTAMHGRADTSVEKTNAMLPA